MCRNHKLWQYILLIAINLFPFKPFNNIYALENREQITNKNETLLPPYILGPGDKLRIKVFRMKDFNSTLEVLPDGTINLPRYGSLSVDGLQLVEAKGKILAAYKTILKKPVIYLDILQFKPVSILITGEVQNPGIYSMGLKRNNFIQGSTGEKSLKLESSGWPTIIDAIQVAGGVTTNANLRNVILFRKKIGEKEQQPLKINLWELIKNGDIDNNVYIYSGDTINIEKASKINKNEKKLISNSNLSTSTILVNVVGEVFKPGFQKIKANSQPINALLSAGGLNQYANNKKIKLIRLRDDGTVFAKSFEYEKLITSKNNNDFYLLDKDVIVVPTSPWTKTKRAIQDFTNPIIRGSQIYNLFE